MRRCFPKQQTQTLHFPRHSSPSKSITRKLDNDSIGRRLLRRCQCYGQRFIIAYFYFVLLLLLCITGRPIPLKTDSSSVFDNANSEYMILYTAYVRSYELRAETIEKHTRTHRDKVSINSPKM